MNLRIFKRKDGTAVIQELDEFAKGGAQWFDLPVVYEDEDKPKRLKVKIGWLTGFVDGPKQYQESESELVKLEPGDILTTEEELRRIVEEAHSRQVHYTGSMGPKISNEELADKIIQALRGKG